MSEGEISSEDIPQQLPESAPPSPETKRSPNRLRMLGVSLAAAGALVSACGSTEPGAIENYEAAEYGISGGLMPFAHQISEIKPGQIPDSEITYTGAGSTKGALGEPLDPLGTKTVTVTKDGKDCSFTILGILSVDSDHAAVTSQDPITGWYPFGFSTIRGIGVETKDAGTKETITSVNADMNVGTLVTLSPEGKPVTYRSNPGEGERQLTDDAIARAAYDMKTTFEECTTGGQG